MFSSQVRPHHSNHDVNPILALFHDDWVNVGSQNYWWRTQPNKYAQSWLSSIVEIPTGYPNYSGIEKVSSQATTAQREHALKVITRCANFPL